MKTVLEWLLTLCCLSSRVLQLGADSSTTQLPPDNQDFIGSVKDFRHWSELRREIPVGSLASSSTSSSVVSMQEHEDKPFLKLTTNSSLVKSAGQTVYLHCQVENLGDRQVSWIRRSDLKILTIGPTLYTQDSRFSPLHEPGSDVWILKLTQAAVEDSGDYECQVSYHDDVEKKLKIPYSLTILDSHAYIHDSPDLHVQRGSKLHLTCYVRDSSRWPDYVYWYRNDQVLNYNPAVLIEDHLHNNGSDESVVVSLAKPDILVSRLSIDHVTKHQSGNYSCSPSNARSTSIMVHVVDDESGPAAMQHGNSAAKLSYLSMMVTILMMTGCFATCWSSFLQVIIRSH